MLNTSTKSLKFFEAKIFSLQSMRHIIDSASREDLHSMIEQWNNNSSHKYILLG